MVGKFSVQALIGGSIQLLLFPLLLFLAAGTLAWPAGWIFVLLFYGFVACTVRLLLRRNPGLLEERMSVFKPNLNRDSMFVLVSVIALAWVCLIPLDAVRFHWSHLSIWFQVVGVVVLLGAYVMMYLAFRENAYLTPTVRIQKEREHEVVSSGPYRYVRHPMYTGFHLFFIGMPLLLGSAFGLVLSLVLMGVLFRRAVMEERLLQANLPGYSAYMAQVNARFVPYVW